MERYVHVHINFWMFSVRVTLWYRSVHIHVNRVTFFFHIHKGIYKVLQYVRNQPSYTCRRPFLCNAICYPTCSCAAGVK